MFFFFANFSLDFIRGYNLQKCDIMQVYCISNTFLRRACHANGGLFTL